MQYQYIIQKYMYAITWYHPPAKTNFHGAHHVNLGMTHNSLCLIVRVPKQCAGAWVYFIYTHTNNNRSTLIQIIRQTEVLSLTQMYFSEKQQQTSLKCSFWLGLKQVKLAEIKPNARQAGEHAFLTDIFEYVWNAFYASCEIFASAFRILQCQAWVAMCCAMQDFASQCTTHHGIWYCTLNHYTYISGVAKSCTPVWGISPPFLVSDWAVPL